MKQLAIGRALNDLQTTTPIPKTTQLIILFLITLLFLSTLTMSTNALLTEQQHTAYTDHGDGVSLDFSATIIHKYLNKSNLPHLIESQKFRQSTNASQNSSEHNTRHMVQDDNVESTFITLPIDINSPFIDVIVVINCETDRSYCRDNAIWELTDDPPKGCQTHPDTDVVYQQTARWHDQDFALLMRTRSAEKTSTRGIMHPWTPEEAFVEYDVVKKNNVENNDMTNDPTNKNDQNDQKNQTDQTVPSNPDNKYQYEYDLPRALPTEPPTPPKILYGLIRITETKRCSTWQSDYVSTSDPIDFLINGAVIRHGFRFIKYPPRHNLGAPVLKLSSATGAITIGNGVCGLGQDKSTTTFKNTQLLNHNDLDIISSPNNYYTTTTSSDSNDERYFAWNFNLGGIALSNWSKYLPTVHLIPYGLLQMDHPDIYTMMETTKCWFSDYSEPLKTSWVQIETHLAWGLLFNLPTTTSLSDPLVFFTRAAHNIRCQIKMTGQPGETYLPFALGDNNDIGVALLFTQENEYSPASLVLFTPKSDYAPLPVIPITRSTHLLEVEISGTDLIRFIADEYNTTTTWRTITQLEYTLTQRYVNGQEKDSFHLNNNNNNNNNNGVFYHWDDGVGDDNNDDVLFFDPLSISQHNFTLFMSDIHFAASDATDLPPTYTMICNNTVIGFGNTTLAKTFKGMYEEMLYLFGEPLLITDYKGVINTKCQSNQFQMVINHALHSTQLPFPTPLINEEQNSLNNDDNNNNNQNMIITNNNNNPTNSNQSDDARYSFLDASYILSPGSTDNTITFSPPYESVYSVQIHNKETNINPTRTAASARWIKFSCPTNNNLPIWNNTKHIFDLTVLNIDFIPFFGVDHIATLPRFTIKVQSAGWQFTWYDTDGLPIIDQQPPGCTASPFNHEWNTNVDIEWTTQPPYSIYPLGLTFVVQPKNETMESPSTLSSILSSLSTSTSTSSSSSSFDGDPLHPKAPAPANYAQLSLHCPGLRLIPLVGISEAVISDKIVLTLTAETNDVQLKDVKLPSAVQIYHLDVKPFPLIRILIISGGGLGLLLALVTAIIITCDIRLCGCCCGTKTDEVGSKQQPIVTRHKKRSCCCCKNQSKIAHYDQAHNGINDDDSDTDNDYQYYQQHDNNYNNHTNNNTHNINNNNNTLFSPQHNNNNNYDVIINTGLNSDTLNHSLLNAAPSEFGTADFMSTAQTND